MECTVEQVVEMPLGPVSEHSDVALLQRCGAPRNVPGELIHGFGPNVADPKVTLDLEDRVPDLDVDPTSLTRRRLEDDLVEVGLSEVKRRSSEEHVQVALYVRFRTPQPTVNQPTN